MLQSCLALQSLRCANASAHRLAAGGESDVGRAWAELREQAVQAAVRELLPQMEREARSRLAANARASVVQQASDQLWQLASRAPLTVSAFSLASSVCEALAQSLCHNCICPPAPQQVKLVDEDAEVSERRVMAVSYGPGNPATTCVMLDPSGNLVDYLHCPQLRCALCACAWAACLVLRAHCTTMARASHRRCPCVQWRHPAPKGRARRGLLCV